MRKKRADWKETFVLREKKEKDMKGKAEKKNKGYVRKLESPKKGFLGKRRPS